MTRKAETLDSKQEEQIKNATEKILQHQQKETAMSQVKNSGGKSIGVDVGTSKIVLAERPNGKAVFSSRTNAFIPMEYSQFSEDILKQNQVDYFRIGNSLIVYGNGAETFANMLNQATRRPMSQGLLNPKEENAIDIIQAILENLVPEAESKDTQLCFSIPSVSNGKGTDIIYHEAILKRKLAGKGYKVKSINEGLAVVLSELGEENFTGMGISIGGGMCNVCLAYLSVPLISFSIDKGGDYIDEAVSSVTREVSTRVRKIKETQLDLTQEPRNEIEDALHIYYEELITTLVGAIRQSIAKTSKAPNLDQPVPIVLGGGTVLPKGFREHFERALAEEPLPLQVSEVRLAKDPLNATANGALIAASYAH